MKQRTKDVLWLAVILFAIWCGYDILRGAGERLAASERNLSEQYTDADHFCAWYARENSEWSDQYRHRDLLRMCYIHRIEEERAHAAGN